MRYRARSSSMLSVVAVLVVLGTAETLRAQQASDGGVSDAGVVDGGLSDAGVVDGGLSDAGAVDGGLSDAGAPSLTPPSVLERVEAVYPPEALAAGLTASVEVLVTIAPDGSVTDATVPSPVGQGFDEAAIAAVRRFRFEPARRDGTPILARIRYRYDFALPVAAEPPVEAPTSGRLSGRIVAAPDGAPVEAALVTLVDLHTNEEQSLSTDAEGRFAIDELAPGRYRVSVSGVGLTPWSHEEEIVAGEETSVAYRLAAVADEGDARPTYSARAAIDPPAREMTRRTIEREELYRIPGTRGDPIRTIEILPGVARPPFGLGFVIVRGAAPTDTGIYIDGVPVPLIYHFGGLTSVYNGRLLDRLNYFPGNFSSRYGRNMGGVVEIDSRDPREDKFHGIVDLNLIDMSILLEGPLTKRFAIAASFRRSFLDAWLPSVIPKSSTDLTAAPVYYDYQLLGTWRPTSRDRIRFQFYGSDDHFALIARNTSEANASAAKGSLGLTTRFQNVQATWTRQLGRNTDQTVLLAIGPQVVRFNAGVADTRFELRVTQIYARAQWLTRLSRSLRLVSGIDVLSGPYSATYVGNPPSQGEGGTQDTTTLIGLRTNAFVMRPGVYADLAFERGKVLLNSALRLDYFSEIRNYAVDPRFVFKYSVRPTLRLKAAAGLFSQPPQFQESNPVIGNETLRPQHAAQFAIGSEWEIRPGMTVSAEGFYKQLWSRVIQAQSSADTTPFHNGGRGRIYGLELSGTFRHPQGKYFAFFSYTLLRSERQDRPEEPWRKFDFDQTHILSASFVYRLPHHWEVGATFRYSTGNPYTPVAGRVWDSTSRSYYPVLGMTNSARNPSFNRLDVRIQKTWEFHSWKLALYLDVQNVYNHRTREALLYNYDFTLTQPIKGLPVIPALGVRGEF